jgi:integrase
MPNLNRRDAARFLPHCRPTASLRWPNVLFVFASRHCAPMTSLSSRKLELDRKLDLPNWTLHDLRRTARSLMSRAGIKPHIAERVLGHAIPRVAGVYDRHSYSTEIGDALAQLTGLIERIVNPPADNIVHLRG